MLLLVLVLIPLVLPQDCGLVSKVLTVLVMEVVVAPVYLVLSLLGVVLAPVDVPI